MSILSLVVRLALSLPFFGAACGTSSGPQILTIPGEPLKHADTPLEVPDGQQFATNENGGERVLGFDAIPDAGTSAEGRRSSKPYHATNQGVYEGEAPGVESRFRRDYWFFVQDQVLFVARYGNPASTGEPLRLTAVTRSEAGATADAPVDVHEYHDSYSLGQFYAHDKADVLLEVTVGEPRKRRLYRARIGTIERCLDGECKAR